MNENEVLAWLRRTGTRRTVEGMARYGLPSDRAFGVTVGAMQAMAKRIGKDHDLAEALWASGWYEARMMATFVGDPRRNFVKKGVNWALRSIGKRSRALNAAGVASARRLALSDEPAPRWVGKDALRELASPKVRSRLARGKLARS